jgi:hypothetical protein
MNAGHSQTSTTEPEILFERLPAKHCKCLLFNEFLFKWKTSS